MDTNIKNKRKLTSLCAILIFTLVFTVIPLQFNTEVASAKTYNSQQDAVIDLAMAKKGQGPSHFGFTDAWCTRFINWAMEAAGLNNGTIYPKNGLGNCTNFAQHFKSKGTYVSLYNSGPGYFGSGTKVNKNYIPKKGDIVFFKKNNKINHVALVVSVTLKNNIPNKVTVVHGNWLDKVAVTEHNGHGITYASEIIGYATPIYSTGKWTTKDPVKETFTNYSATGTVNVDSGNLNVRSGAGTTYSSIGKLAKGKSVTITAKSANWYKINYGSSTGYVSAQYIKIKGATTTTSNTSVAATNKTGTVTASPSLNVRKDAGTKYAKIGSLKKNAKVTITGTKGSWYQIKYGSTTGYVSNAHVKVTGATSTSTSVTAMNKKGAVNLSSGTLNVRKDAGTNYSKIGSLKNKATVTITGAKGDWYRIKYGSSTGFVSKKYIKIK